MEIKKDLLEAMIQDCNMWKKNIVHGILDRKTLQMELISNVAVVSKDGNWVSSIT